MTDNKSSSAVRDVVVIGAGPAALSAAIYTTREDIDTLLIEKGVVGGLAAITHLIENYPGFPDGVAGMELSDRLRKQAERFGAKIEYGEVAKITDGGESKSVHLADGSTVKARAVLISTGNDYRKADVKGEKEYHGRGVHYCATCDGPLYKGKKLVVIGGGNSAAQETLFLARLAEHVDILIRKDKWRASDILIDRINQTPNVKVHFNTEVSEILGKDKVVNKVVAKNNQTNKTTEFDVEGVFVFVGLIPNTKFLDGSGVKLDERGFVITNDDYGTNVLGIFSAGDVRSGATEQIASAVGEGAAAALTIREYLHQTPARKHLDKGHRSMEKGNTPIW